MAIGFYLFLLQYFNIYISIVLCVFKVVFLFAILYRTKKLPNCFKFVDWKEQCLSFNAKGRHLK